MKRLQQLINKINNQVQNNGIINVLELQPILKEYAGKDWTKHLKIKNGQPENTILLQNEQVKVVLIYWDAHKKSKKHGHPKGGGLMKLMSGNLVETRFDPESPDQIIGEHHYEAENMAYIHDRLAYHVVENPTDKPAVSLHIYSPGIYASNIIESKASITIDLKTQKAA